jgi:phosphoglycolate phosphatase-like HAD superfamily hydrolase
MDASNPTIVLFDIDGTLLLTGGAGRRAFARAFHDIVGDAGGVHGFSFQGMTDRAIARRGLEALGRKVDAPLVECLITRYLDALEDELSKTEEYRVLPGVEPLLSALAPVARLSFGLGTGNVRKGAEAKLRRGGLLHHFAFGGFGCDHEERSKLIAAGAARGAQALRQPVEHCRLVVVGDTVLDVAAAHANGAECIAVCTGGNQRAELEGAGAELVVDDLRAASVLACLLR